MAKYLVTPTLYNAYFYYKTLGGDFPAKKEEFLATLTKQPFKMTEPILKGMEFEKVVHKYATGQSVEVPNKIAEELGAITAGGTWQVTLKKDIKIAEWDILLYGKADVVKEDEIIDVKRSKQYKEGKYFNSIQHLIYMECGNANKFRYLVATGAGEATDWAPETYYYDSLTLPTLKARIWDMLEWFKKAGHIELYKQHWVSKY